jgi:hypothetical protein
MLHTDSECTTCEARQGSAQSAMTPAKKQALNHSMEQAIKQTVVRELVRWCTQYSTGSTLESKLLMLRFHSIESRVNAGAG